MTVLPVGTFALTISIDSGRGAAAGPETGDVGDVGPLPVQPLAKAKTATTRR